MEAAREFYNAPEAGVGEYCVSSLLADIESLVLFHGIHRQQYGCYRMLASRFPFGMYFLETDAETRVVAALDLRRHLGWIREQVSGRQSFANL